MGGAARLLGRPQAEGTGRVGRVEPEEEEAGVGPARRGLGEVGAGLEVARWAQAGLGKARLEGAQEVGSSRVEASKEVGNSRVETS